MKALTLAAASAASVIAFGSFVTPTFAAPYASGVSQTGQDVSFILNETASTLTVNLGDGSSVVLTPTAGSKTFTLPSGVDTYSITASSLATPGYTTEVANAGVAAQITDDANVRNSFYSPRGVAVNVNPNNGSQFGSVYVSNALEGATAANGRTTGLGVFANGADGSDLYSQSDTAFAGGLSFDAASGFSPFKMAVGVDDGQLYVTDWTDSLGNLSVLPGNLSGAGTRAFPDDGGPSATSGTPYGQNHGSVNAVYAQGSLANGDLTIFTIDEDLPGPNGELNALYRYDIGSGALPYSDDPTFVNSVGINFVSNIFDVDRSPDGKFYISNQRLNNTPNLFVLSADGQTVLYDSFTDTTDMDSAATVDLLNGSYGNAVSPDGKYIALGNNAGQIIVVPLDDEGLPILEERSILQAFDSGIVRDVAFDAAGNVYGINATAELVRGFSPGGLTDSTLAFDGTNFTFTNGAPVPEPASLGLLGVAGLGLLRRRRA